MSDLHETHVCRDCGAEITLPYATPPAEPGRLFPRTERRYPSDDHWDTATPPADSPRSDAGLDAIIDDVIARALVAIEGVDPGPWVRTRRVLDHARQEIAHPEFRAAAIDAARALSQASDDREAG